MDKDDIATLLRDWPRDFFGVDLYDEQELHAASTVIYNRSPFRYYGNKCTREAATFEEEAAEFFDVAYAHSTNSGTGALFAALHALDVGPGDEVIVPGYFWIAISNAIIHRGAIPVFAEIDESLNIDPKDLETRITSKTKTVIAVHMFGAQADVERIKRICDSRRLTLLEDISQAIGSEIGGKKTGGIGDIGVSSLQVNKMITSGEGGLVLTNSDEYYRKVTAITDFGYPRADASRNADEGQYVTFGAGRRFNEVSAAIMRVQLRKLPELKARLRATKRHIKSELGKSSLYRFRKCVDESGECGSTLTLIFEKPKYAARLIEIVQEEYGDKMPFMQLSRTGLHVYHRCSNLVKKVPLLPGGFPWSLPENQGDYHYEEGTLPQTDEILGRSIGLNLPITMSELHIRALVSCLNCCIAKLEAEAETVGV